MAIYESGDRIEYGPTSYEKAVIEDHRDELERTIAALRALVEELRQGFAGAESEWEGWIKSELEGTSHFSASMERAKANGKSLALTEDDMLRRLEEK